MLKDFDFVTGKERRSIRFPRGFASVPQIKTSVKAFLTVGGLLLTIVGGGGEGVVVGGQISPSSGGNIMRNSGVQSKSTQQHSLLHLQAKCGIYSVCNLATHFCDTVMSTCVSCSDDCHPGRITGDPYAVEDCQQKCRVYYELERERSQMAISKSKEDHIRERQISTSRSEDLQHQVSRRTNDSMISVTDELYESLKRFELLKAIETICIAVITLMLFVISISLMFLLRRLDARSYARRKPNILLMDSVSRRAKFSNHLQTN